MNVGEVHVTNVERSTWINTIAGMLDQAFSLTDEEFFFCSQVVRQLLGALRIPERGAPSAMPAALALEAKGGMYSLQVHGSRDAGVQRPVRATAAGDVVVTLEAWRQALLNLICSAYTDLTEVEVLTAAKTFDDLLIGIGVPQRAAAYVPSDVVRAHLEGA